MKTIIEATKFEGSNVSYGEGQEEYKPLHAFKHNTKEGHMVTCWKLSFRQKLLLLFTGKIWLCVMTFNSPLQPLLMSTNKEDFLLDAPEEDTQE